VGADRRIGRALPPPTTKMSEWSVVTIRDRNSRRARGRFVVAQV